MCLICLILSSIDYDEYFIIFGMQYYVTKTLIIRCNKTLFPVYGFAFIYSGNLCFEFFEKFTILAVRPCHTFEHLPFQLLFSNTEIYDGFLDSPYTLDDIRNTHFHPVKRDISPKSSWLYRIVLIILSELSLFIIKAEYVFFNELIIKVLYKVD